MHRGLKLLLTFLSEAASSGIEAEEVTGALAFRDNEPRVFCNCKAGG